MKNGIREDSDSNTDLDKLVKNTPSEKEILIKSESSSSSPDIFLLEKLIETFHFSRFHLAILLVCIFSMMSDGYLIIHMKTSQGYIAVKYNWDETKITIMTTLQVFSSIFGAVISTNCRSSHWDISSNAFLAAMGLLSTIMITLFSDPNIYCFLICVFAFCNGFIGNICTNFLVELFKLELRGMFFLIAFSFKFVGMGMAGVVYFLLFNYYQIDNPSLLVIGLTVSQLGLTLSSIFVLESPRVLFFNSEPNLIYEYIHEVFTDGQTNLYNQKFKTQIVEKLDVVRKEIEKSYGKQQNSGVFYNYYFLWIRPHLNITLKSIYFLFLSTVFMCNGRDSFIYYLKYYNLGLNTYLFSESMNTLNLNSVPYYSSQFIISLGLCLCYYYFPRVKRIHHAIFCITSCVFLMILILIIRNGFVYLICLFEALSFYYFFLLYLYFSEMTTTKLRNSLTSIMFSTTLLAGYCEGFFVKLIGGYNPNFLLIINFFIAGFLLLGEFLMINYKEEIRYQSLLRIELDILADDK